MPIAKKIIREISWLGLFKLMTQGFSWGVTFKVANILVPGDYGLMEMATIFTVYGEKFSELGLGAAIIQKSSPTREQLSSVFWFSLGISSFFAMVCFFVSYPTAFVFNDPRIIPITQLASVIFIINGLQVVPTNLLKKEMSFKKVGIIEFLSTFTSCASMLIFAIIGLGVWTLILGRIVNGMVRLLLVYSFHSWKPSIHYKYAEAKHFFIFGSKVALSRTIYYVYEKSDNFLIGKYWPPANLGYYTFSKELSKIPTDRIIGFVRQISFPMLASVKRNPRDFNRIYLKIVSIIATITFPIFMGGFLIGKDLIEIVLEEKWYPMIPLFRYLCLIEIVSSVISINNLVHLAKGRPDYSLYFSLVRALVMAISFYLAVQHGYLSILIPWFSSYLIISLFWIIFTLKKIDIGLTAYLCCMAGPFLSTLVMTAGLFLLSYCIKNICIVEPLSITILFSKIGVGVSLYLMALWFIDREIYTDVISMIKK